MSLGLGIKSKVNWVQIVNTVDIYSFLCHLLTILSKKVTDTLQDVLGLNILYSFSKIQHTKHNNIARHVNGKDLTVSVSL